MDEFSRISAKSQPAKTVSATVSAYADRANHYQVTAASGMIYRNIYSPWMLYVGDAVVLSVGKSTHAAEIIGYNTRAAATPKEVSI